MKRSFYLKVLALVLAVGGLVSCQTPSMKEAPETFFTVAHVNDIHGRLYEGKYEGMGFAKISTIVGKLRSENPHLLLLDGGDTFHGTSISNLSKGESVVAVYNQLHFTAAVAGNHDFNYGWRRLKELNEKADFPILSANIIDQRGSLLLSPSVIVSVGELRVAILGLSTPETRYKSHPKGLKGLTFLDPIQVAKERVPALRKKAHVVIALVHLGVSPSSEDTSIRLAEEVDGIDLIVDGHSHTALPQGKRVNGTLIAQTGGHDKQLGIISLHYKEGHLTTQARLFTKAQAKDVPKDPEVVELLADWRAASQDQLSEVVAFLPESLGGEKYQVRQGSTKLGQMITSAILEATGAQIALHNGGGIRANLDAGPVSREEILLVFPFGNTVVVKEVRGSTVLAILEHGLKDYPAPSGGFPHVGGLTYKFDPSQPPGQRVSSVEVQGKPLENDRLYTLATNDFLTAGGDGYVHFKETKTVKETSNLDDIIEAYLRKHYPPKTSS